MLNTKVSNPTSKANIPCPGKGDDRGCLPPSSMCDGVKTCRNGSDEDPDFCSSWECGENRLKCPDDIQCAAKTDLCVKVRHAFCIVLIISASSFEATDVKFFQKTF